MPSILSNKRRQIIQTVTLSLYRFDTIWHKAWAFVMMGLARVSLSKTPHLQFWKLLGSGTGQGFTPIPNWGVYAVLCVWDNGADVRANLEHNPLFKRYRERATQTCTIFLEPTSSRGQWSGQTPFDPLPNTNAGPVAILTRATLRWSKILQFWGQAPAISKRIGENRKVMFKIGLGEVPLRQQLTFSIWPNVSDMAQFAHAHGAHKSAIAQVRQGRWFKEELYARFNITMIDGYWSDFNKQLLRE